MARHYDIAIIGGGTVGAMIFLDAALRGWNCVLIERKSVGMQTNRAALGLIQAGANYLLKDRGSVFANAQDAKLLCAIAPQFVRRARFVIPIFSDSRHSFWMWDGFFGAYDFITERDPEDRHERWPRARIMAAEPFLRSDLCGAIAFYERLSDPVALTNAVADLAIRFGGTLAENTEVIRSFSAVASGGKQVFALETRMPGGKCEQIRASCVINAAGPWAPLVLERVFRVPSFETRMTKGVSIILNERLTRDAVILFDGLGKYIAVIPLDGGRTLVGPTNSDAGFLARVDPDLVVAEEEDVEELLATVSRFFCRPLGREAVAETRCGLRPQLNHRGVRPNDISHAFAIIDHEERDGIPNLLTVFGGKLSNQIRMAKEAVDAASLKLGAAKTWWIPFVRISPKNAVKSPFMPVPISESYEKARALSRRDDITAKAFWKKAGALMFLAPFLAAAFAREKLAVLFPTLMRRKQ